MNLRDTLYQIRTTGEMPEIPKIQKSKLRWLFYGLINIVKELNELGIETSDYTNVRNLGLKTNGRLGMFDIGFGNAYESDEEIERIMVGSDTLQVLDRIKDILGIKYDTKYLGSGMFGHAHYIGNKRVLKLTTDKSEAVNSKKIMGRKNNTISNIYDVRAFETTKGKRYYVIILEYLQPLKGLNNLYMELEDEINELNNVHLDVSVLNNIRDKNIRSMLLSFVENGSRETWDKFQWLYMDKKYDKYDFNEIEEISKWIKNSVTNYNDGEDRVPGYINNYIKMLSRK